MIRLSLRLSVGHNPPLCLQARTGVRFSKVGGRSEVVKAEVLHTAGDEISLWGGVLKRIPAK